MVLNLFFNSNFPDFPDITRSYPDNDEDFDDD